MNVLLTVNFSPWSAYSGGGQRSTHNLACALQARGHRVTVVYTRPPWEWVDVPARLPYAVRWAPLWARRSASSALLRPLTALAVERVVDAELTANGPSIVHGNGEEASLVPRLRARHRFGFLMTPRYPAFPDAMLDGSWRKAHVKLGLALRHTRYVQLGWALAGADLCCPTSEHSAAQVMRVYGLSAERVRVVPNGVSEAFLSAARAPDAEHGPAVFFGRIAAEKGAATLIEAWALLGARAPELVLVGRGPALPGMLERASQRGIKLRHVAWLDAPELATLLASASMAVLPSLEESFGNAMAEAMALGLPVVSTTAGSIPEVIEHEQSGLLVPPGDATALAAAVRGLIDEPARARALGEAARARVRERFTWQAVAARFEALYAAALSP